MRTVVKAVFRSFGASVATNVVTLESQSRPDMTHQMKRKDITQSDNFSFHKSASGRDASRHFEIKTKTESLSPIYQLNSYEQTSFEELQDKECDYYPNNSTRGDSSVLNMDIQNSINEGNVNSNDIVVALKNIHFINSIVFKQDFDIYLTTANYIQRLLHIKAVKKDLMQFICAAMYDLALEYKIGKALSKDQIALLLSLTKIPINHIEDFSRMKALLLSHLNNDLGSVSLIDYLEIILKINLRNNPIDNLPESQIHLIEIAKICATSCELTHFTLACQAISLITVAARHTSFDPVFSRQFAPFIEKFPMIFVSPVRLSQFAKLDNVTEENIKNCAECMVRFFSKYYGENRGILTQKMMKIIRKSNLRDDCGSQLEIVIEEDENLITECKDPKLLDISELMEKLSRIKVALNCPINGKQRQRHRRAKKKLSRQLKKYDRSLMERVAWKPLTIDDEDSAISSSSNMTSPVNSPSSF